MDSLTQITLGAAVGEVVLGKKVGNRAMLWGAIGGTVPDLDVFANMATDEISALAFHRAITHSFAFAALAPIVLGGLVHHIYKQQRIGQAFGLSAALIFLMIALGSVTMPVPPIEVLKVAGAITAAILFFPLVSWGAQTVRGTSDHPWTASWRDWSWLFFWAVFTHPLLDACTTYGTQLFRPFWDYRVAFNNISVADPAYTFPFLLLLLAAFIVGRKRQALRTRLNTAGLVVSSLYLAFTFANKWHINRTFEASLQREDIPYERYMTSPTILNNLLWQGIAEGDTAYYHSMYSIMDEEAVFEGFTVIPKRHELLHPAEGSRDLEVLQWFSDGYYSVFERGDTALQYNDLRFGSLNQSFEEPSDFVFHFILEQDEDGEWRARQGREQPRDMDKAFSRLWNRMMGRK